MSYCSVDGKGKLHYNNIVITSACSKLECGDGIPLRLKSLNLRFESDVVSNRSQTLSIEPLGIIQFESDVVSNRSQTNRWHSCKPHRFESDVVSNRSQTLFLSVYETLGFESDVVSNRSQTLHAQQCDQM